jgi:orotidine 5'-phosphate decarboxylase subfamily 2
LTLAPAAATWVDRLGARTGQTGTTLCLGIDPDPRSLPTGFPPDVDGIERFAGLLLDAALSVAAAIKINIAFFEAWGSRGIAALERLRERIPDDLPLILDAKRGDIGSTSEQHAHAIFDHLGAAAVTASPYLGPDAIAPLLDRPDRFVYLLCRTSNPGAGELQALEVAPDAARGLPAEPLAHRVARLASGWQRHPETVGLVVGATAPDELAAIRAIAPELPFLVPGVGSQGGDVESALLSGRATSGPAGQTAGGGLLVNVSRCIADAARASSDPADALAAAASRWARILQVLR